MIKWDQADFIDASDGGLAADIDDVSVTVLSRGDRFTVAWSLNVEGSLPDVEEIATRVAQAIRRTLDDDFETVHVEPEGS